MQVTFRLAGINDIPLLAKTRLDFLRALGYSVPDEAITSAQQQIETFLQERLNKQIFAWLAIVEEQPVSVGFLQIYNVMYHPKSHTGRYGRIINMLTLPEYRNQGLARGIMERLIALANEFSLDFIDLDASPDGRHLYESLGFLEQHPIHPPMSLDL